MKCERCNDDIEENDEYIEFYTHKPSGRRVLAYVHLRWRCLINDRPRKERGKELRSYLK